MGTGIFEVQNYATAPFHAFFFLWNGVISVFVFKFVLKESRNILRSFLVLHVKLMRFIKLYISHRRITSIRYLRRFDKRRIKRHFYLLLTRRLLWNFTHGDHLWITLVQSLIPFYHFSFFLVRFILSLFHLSDFNLLIFAHLLLNLLKLKILV